MSAPASIRIAQIQAILGVKPDGEFGPISRHALEQTIAAREAERAGAPGGEPRWLTIARRELGVSEVVGSADNPRIVEYHRATSLKATDDETPWCAAFVNWCLGEAGLTGSGSAAARSFAEWGRPLGAPHPGCIVVLRRGTGGQGHVGFYIGGEGMAIRLLGGNQGDKVSIASYSASKLIGYRWPDGEPIA